LFASRFLSLALISATASLGLLVAGAPQTASAAAPAHTAPSPASGTPKAGYQAAPGADPAPNLVSPSGCIQRADYPHRSSHLPGTAAGVVTTTCNQYVPEIAFTAQMWETRWWGWDRIGTRGVVARWGVKQISATAWDWCKKNTVRVTASGHVIDVDFRWYYANTESVHVTNPCGL
jgi:hypothetical protein